MRRIISILMLTALLAAGACFMSGCGGNDEPASTTQEPGQFLDDLNDAAARGQVDRLLEMMTPAAQSQTMDQWASFLRRTGNLTGQKAYQQLTIEERRDLARAETKAFFEKMKEKEKNLFARFFSVGYVAHLEQNNLVLMRVTGESGAISFLAMKRDDSGKLLLASEAESADAYRQLSRALEAHIQEMRKKAEEEAKNQPQE